MKTVIILLGILPLLHRTQAGITPVSTTLVRQSTSITHPSAVTYSQPALTYSQPAFAYSQPSIAYNQPAIAYGQPAVSYSYSAPASYSVYPQQLVRFNSGLFTPSHGSFFVPSTAVFAQYPGFVQQSPVFSGEQHVSTGAPGNLPPVEAAADAPQPIAPQQPIPQPPPQQSPILGGGDSPGTTVDDDTVSVEAS